MRKVLSLALVIVMIATMSLAVSAKDNASIEIPYFNILPTIDGAVSVEEWGEPTVHVTPDQAQSFYCDAGGGTLDISFDLWLRWTESGVYLAVVTKDPDGHSLPDGEGSLWNGDVIQFRFDPAGSNSSDNPAAPWGDASIPNMSFGQMTDGSLASWDFQNSQEIDGLEYKVTVADGVTTYEGLLPHSYIAGKGEAGFVYGFALVRLNAPAGAAYNAWLTWGDGICGPQDDADRCGSNGITLAKVDAIIPPVVEIEEADEAAPAEAAAEVAAAPATAPAAAQTSDAGYAMFAILALISLAGAVVVAKKVR